MNKKEIEQVFVNIGKELKEPADITICGGANMVLLSDHRESTLDIDFIQSHIDVASIISRVAPHIVNDDVRVTTSYSPILMKYRKLYKTYGNLSVYTLEPVALLCMKLKSFREDSHDLEDIEVLTSMVTSIDEVYKHFAIIYPMAGSMSVDAEMYLQNMYCIEGFMLDKESIESYRQMIDDKLIKFEELPESIQKQLYPNYKNDRRRFNAIVSTYITQNPAKSFNELLNPIKAEVAKELSLNEDTISSMMEHLKSIFNQTRLGENKPIKTVFTRILNWSFNNPSKSLDELKAGILFDSSTLLNMPVDDVAQLYTTIVA